jgi:Leucine-rich repeat (LRR) protein
LLLCAAALVLYWQQRSEAQFTTPSLATGTYLWPVAVSAAATWSTGPALDQYPGQTTGGGSVTITLAAGPSAVILQSCEAAVNPISGSPSLLLNGGPGSLTLQGNGTITFSGGVIIGAGTSLAIGGGGTNLTVVFTGSFFIDPSSQITVNSGSVLQLNDATQSTGTGKIQGPGTVIVQAPSTATPVNGSLFGASGAGFNGKLTVSSNISLQNTLSFASSSVLDLSVGNVLINTASGINFTNSTGTPLTGTGKISGSGNTSTISIANTNFNGKIIPTTYLSSPLNALLLVNAAASFALNGDLTLGSNSALSLGGSAALNTGAFALSIASTASPALGIQAGSALNASAAGARIYLNTPSAGALQVPAGSTNLISGRAATTISLGPSFNGNTLATNAAPFGTVNGVMEINNGTTLNALASSLSVAATGRLRLFDGSNISANAASLSYAAGATVEYTGTGSVATGAEFLSTMNANVELNKSSGGIVSLNSAKTMIAGTTFNVLSNTALDLNGTSLSLQGTASLTQGSIRAMGVNTEGLVFAAGTSIASGSRLNFTTPSVGFIRHAAASQTLSLASDLTVISSNGFSIGSGAVFDIKSFKLTVQNGSALFNSGVLSADNAGSLIIDNNVSLTNNAQLQMKSGSTLEIKGGTGTFVGTSPVNYATGSTLLFSGSAAYSATSIALPPTMLGNMTVNNAGGLAITSATAISGAVSVVSSGPLVLSAGTQLAFNGAVNFGVASDIQGVSGSMSIGGTGAIAGTFRTSTGLTNFTMNRPAAQVTLATPLTLSGILTLLQGYILSSSASPVIITGTAESAVSGGNTGSFVRGPLQRRLPPNQGVGTAFLFPVGKDTTYLPFRLVDAATGTAGADVTVEAFNSYHGGAAGPTLQNVSITEYWTMNVAGSLANSSVQLSSAVVTSTAVVAYAPIPSGNYISAGNVLYVPPLQGSTTSPNGAVTSQRLPPAPVYVVGNIGTKPVVLSITPALGGNSTVATITGTGFAGTTGATSVRIGTTPVRSYAVLDDRTIIATLDSIPGVQQPTAFSIGVSAPGGVTTSTVTVFTYYPRPVITGVTPLLGSTGSTVNITGRFFVTTGTVSVRLMDVAFGGAQAAYTVLSTTALVATLTKGGTGAIYVSSPGGQATTSATFTFVNAPVIRSISPPVGSKDTILTIAGENLQTITGATIGGVPAAQIAVVPDGKTIYAVLGSGATGTVALQWPGGVATTTATFVYGSSPTISVVEPPAGTAGTRFTVTGFNLVGVKDVSMNGVPAPFITQRDSLSFTQTITAFVPLGTTGGTVSVTASGGKAFSQQSFTVWPTVAITSASPTQGTAGTIVTLRGINFTTVATVSIGGVPVEGFAVRSTTEIVAVVGKIVTTGSVSLASVNGVTTATFAFVNAPVQPQISALSSPVATIGTVFVITGRFFTGVRGITIGDKPVQEYTVLSPTQISFTVPANVTSGTVTVTTLGGTGTTSSTVTVVQGVYITLFQPPFGTVGVPVRIVGGNFTGVTSVRFGDLRAASVQIVSDNVIIATPAPGSQTGIVTITGPIGIGLSQRPFSILTRTQIDSAALRIIYDSTGGVAWRRQDGWLKAADIDDWDGVTVESVDGNLRVVALDLSSKGLVAALPETALLLLDAVRVLNASNNQVTGTFPNVTAMKRLEELRLSSNRLSGSLPDTLGAFARLRVLQAASNALSGSLPVTLCNAQNLEELDVGNNALTGQIPSCVGTLNKLQRLDLSGNRFVGSIPAELGNLANLQVLLLQSNQLTGQIPSTFGTNRLLNKAQHASAQPLAQPLAQPSLQATPKLERLNLAGNQLSGEVPLSLASLQALQELNVSNNKLSSTALNAVLQPLTNLRILNLAGNSFGNNYRDSLPTAIATMSGLESLDLRANRFTGPLPSFLGDLFSLRSLLLDSNRFTGAITDDLSNFPSLETLSITANQITALPIFRGEFPKTLNVAQNKLTFTSLENNASRGLVYAPQDSLGAGKDSVVILGTRFQLTAPVAGNEQTTRYQWFLNGVAVTQPRVERTYEVAVFSGSDAGQYVCRVTSLARGLGGLTLATAAVNTSFVRPQPPVDAPLLVFPPDKSSFISTAPQFEWTDVVNATQFEVQVSLRPDFQTIATSATVPLRAAGPTVTGLTGNTQYYWRVRGINPGNQGPWSEPVRSFTTAPANRVLTLSSVDFGKVVLDENSTVQARLTNLSATQIIVRDIILEDPALEFRVGLEVKGAPVSPNQSITVPVSFSPKNSGYKSAKATLQYSLPGSTTIVSEEYPNLLIGRGTPLKILPVQFDTVLIGRAAVTGTLLINRDPRQEVTLLASTLTNTASGTYTMEPSAFGRITIGVGDTTTVLVRCEAKQRGRRAGALQVAANVDTVETDVLAYAREQLSTDVRMRVKLRPDLDSMAPGGKVSIAMSIASADTTIADSLTAKNLVAVLGSSSFEAAMRYDNYVLSYDASKNAYPARNTSSKNRMQRIVFGVQSWQQGTTLTQSLGLQSVRCLAVSGDVETTPLQMEYFRWQRPSSIRGTVFVEAPSNGSFRATACKAGGVRLVRQTTSTALAALPNPAKETSLISFSLRESGFVELSLFDAAGKRVHTITSGLYDAGSYEAVLEVQPFPTGAYFLVLSTPSSIQTQRVDVVK